MEDPYFATLLLRVGGGVQCIDWNFCHVYSRVGGGKGTLGSLALWCNRQIGSPM